MPTYLGFPYTKGSEPAIPAKIHPGGGFNNMALASAGTIVSKDPGTISGLSGTAFSGDPVITAVDSSQAGYAGLPNTTTDQLTAAYTSGSDEGPFYSTSGYYNIPSTYIFPSNTYPITGNITTTPGIYPGLSLGGLNNGGFQFPGTEMVPAEEGIYDVKGGKVIVKKIKVTDQAVQEVMKKFDPLPEINVGELMDLLAEEDREV